jgi:hypothetical protein
VPGGVRVGGREGEDPPPPQAGQETGVVWQVLTQGFARAARSGPGLVERHCGRPRRAGFSAWLAASRAARCGLRVRGKASGKEKYKVGKFEVWLGLCKKACQRLPSTEPDGSGAEGPYSGVLDGAERKWEGMREQGGALVRTATWRPPHRSARACTAGCSPAPPEALRCERPELRRGRRVGAAPPLATAPP